MNKQFVTNGNPLGIMPELKPVKKTAKQRSADVHEKTSAENIPSERIAKKEQKMPNITASELRRGFEISVLLGEPRSKAPYKYRNKIK